VFGMIAIGSPVRHTSGMSHTTLVMQSEL
jgi:hypothetical protein